MQKWQRAFWVHSKIQFLPNPGTLVCWRFIKLQGPRDDSVQWWQMSVLMTPPASSPKADSIVPAVHASLSLTRALESLISTSTSFHPWTANAIGMKTSLPSWSRPALTTYRRKPGWNQGLTATKQQSQEWIQTSDFQLHIHILFRLIRPSSTE